MDNPATNNKKCDCLDPEPCRCYQLKNEKTSKKLQPSGVKYYCSCSCHADYLDGDTDQIKGGC